MQRYLGLCVLVAALGAAAPADAGQSPPRPRQSAPRRLTLKVGDAFVVAHTDLACEAQVGKHVIRGQKLVTCFKVKGGRLPAGSYVAALGANGRAVVGRVTANGSIGAAVFDRKPAALGSGAKQITAQVGDQLLLAGTGILCAVNDDASGVYPTCFRTAPSRAALAHSYAIAETENFVAVVQFDSAGKTTKVVFKRTHGR